MAAEIFYGFLGSIPLLTLLAFILKLWLEVRLKASVEHEYGELKAAIQHEYTEKLEHLKDEIQEMSRIKQARWEIKRQACLEALSVVDAVYSNTEWHFGEHTPVIARQKVDVGTARAAMNKLALACDDVGVLRAYAKALGLHEPGEEMHLNPASINDLRNAARHELGFGRELSLDPAKAWIGSLTGGASEQN